MAEFLPFQFEWFELAFERVQNPLTFAVIGGVEQWTHLPAEYVILIYHYAQQPKESVVENLRLFMEEVKPALDELTDYPE